MTNFRRSSGLTRSDLVDREHALRKAPRAAEFSNDSGQPAEHQQGVNFWQHFRRWQGLQRAASYHQLAAVGCRWAATDSVSAVFRNLRTARPPSPADDEARLPRATGHHVSSTLHFGATSAAALRLLQIRNQHLRGRDLRERVVRAVSALSSRSRWACTSSR